MSIGQQLKQAREGMALTLDEVASMVGVTEASVSRWENDLAVPRPRHKRKLAKALKIPLSAMRNGDRQ